MFGFRWLSRIRPNEKGNVLFIGAACMPLIVGSAGLAVDTVQLALWKRQIQRAADSAAVAGAYTITQEAALEAGVFNDLDEHINSDIAENETPVLKATTILTGSFAQGSVSNATCATRAVLPCFERSVQVELTAEKRMPFISLFTKAANIVKARATAAIVTDGEFCLISLHKENTPGIIAGGNSNLELGCGLTTNARGNSAIHAYGSATIEGSPASSVGGITGTDKFAAGTEFMPYTAPVGDPFQHVADPVLPTGCNTALPDNKDYTAAAPLVITQTKNCFTSWDIQGAVHLEPGVYYVNNGLLDLKGTLTGENVTIVFMGDDSDMTQNGGGQGSTLDISAPESGPYQGIAIFRDRNAKTVQFKINGGAGLKISGAIYGKTTDMWVGGNAEFDTDCLQIVGRVIEFKGGGTIKNECSGKDYGAFKKELVRLVA